MKGKRDTLHGAYFIVIPVLMNIALFIDRFVLSVHQDISDKLQSALGINNFHLAWWMVLHFLVCVLELLLMGQVHLILDGVLVFLMVWDIRRGQKSIKYSSGGIGTRNELEGSVSDRWNRVAWVITIVVLIVLFPIPGFPSSSMERLLWLAKLTTLTSARYFAACTPKPPSKSDLRKLVEAIGRGLKSLIPKPAEPVPVPA